ncbi:MAG: precorrin-4 C(11)-methyltransferase [Gaiellales bacterium]|nr:MAG: precorrin-4 C(11)-methyltransferase [Gaiellales bacterium]
MAAASSRGKDNTVWFVGAGPGDPELITLKGKRLLEEADLVVHAGSLVDPALLSHCAGAELMDSAGMDLGAIVAAMVAGYRAGRRVVRLHSGDPAFYGAIKEQIARLRAEGVAFAVAPGVTSLSAAAAALESELTVPGVSQTVIITRAEGRTPVPGRESLGRLSAHGATMAVFLSAGLAAKVQEQLLEGYPPETPIAVVQNASRPGQVILRTSVGALAADMEAAGIQRTAIILVGETLAQQGEDSRLYDSGFSHGYRKSDEG